MVPARWGFWLRPLQKIETFERILLKYLNTLEIRRTLVQEGIHSLTEILTHIGAQDQVFPLIAGQRPADATYRLLGDFERDRRMAGNEFRGLIGAALQCRD